MNDNSDQATLPIWAYVHGELPDAERQEMEQQISHDPAVRRQVAATELLDRRLRAAFAVLDADETVWADRALVAWDREDAGHVAPLAWGRQLRWPILTGLAAAASLLLLLVPFGSRPSLQWERPAFVPLVTRGATPAATPRLTPATATACAQALRDAVADACRAQGLTTRPGVTISVRIQELPLGAFAMVVRARNRDSSLVEEWSGDYSSVESFNAHLPASAARMAEVLAAPQKP